ncbi:MAG: TetR/AcrR family transcriptional regulator [Melioribacteraceae bacterium]|nr:TetR/AcrR family transcriptional regulator [Melioribacteraceae bacterium]
MKKKEIIKLPENTKYEQLVNTSYNLFMRHGIKRISVEEICQEAGISKMTFYKYFKNKIELAKFVLNKIFNDQMKVYRNIMKEKTSFEKKIEKVILMKHESTEFISKEFFNDLTKNPIEEIAGLMKQFHEDSIKEIMNDLKKAQKKGELRKNIKPDFIFYFLNGIQLMAEDENLSKLYSTPNELIMELTNVFFYGILSNKNVT